MALEKLEQDWAMPDHRLEGLCQFYDLTVLAKAKLPLVLRNAQPEDRPFGREIDLLRCECPTGAEWVDGRYIIGAAWQGTCRTCRKHITMPQPEDTKLTGERGRWYAKITQFVPANVSRF